ncbi:hypothetical protein TWF696_007611 [Orbilia brochopaga]|uniref:Uncharacterized protein n=1 Tax=Orbilia brochopaga TaxID=3140254 RepID=A0AAV9ULU4_9PEZI
MGEQAPRIAHLVLDFDQTLTIDDTLATLASASPLPDAAAIFTHLTNAYLDDYNAHTASHPTPTNVQEEVTFLASLRTVEQRSIERVEASGLFKGIKPQELAAAARRVAVRRPVELAALLSQVLSEDNCNCSTHSPNMSKKTTTGRVSIVSVNWSETFIREVLLALPGLDTRHSSRVEIYANNLLVGADGATTGKLDRRFGTHGLWTAADKMRILDGILAASTSFPLSAPSLSSPSYSSPGGNNYCRNKVAPAAVDTAGTGVDELDAKERTTGVPPRDDGCECGCECVCGCGERGLNVYVGDSATDFAALLLHGGVDRAFVMGGDSRRDNRSLLAICRRQGVAVLSRVLVRDDREEEGGRGGAADAADPLCETGLQQLAGEGDRRNPDNGDGDGAPFRPLYRVAGWSELLECLQHPDRWKYPAT